MEISEKAWDWYIDRLRRVNDNASQRVLLYLRGNGFPQTTEEMNTLIDYCYKVNRTYGEAAAEIACQMYDQIAALSKAAVPSAVPASVADIHEVAKSVVGTLKTENEEIVSSSIGRLVKMAAVDTTMQNALRDGAEWAWIPHGDTCAFCIALASRGWQRASTKAIKNGHAEHIHANCDCTYAIRFNERTTVNGYDPDKYKDMYYGADGYTATQRINSMRREFYEENKERINEQKRDAYAKRKERESSRAEEIDV